MKIKLTKNLLLTLSLTKNLGSNGYIVPYKKFTRIGRYYILYPFALTLGIHRRIWEY